MSKILCEVLSPVGNPESLQAAVRSGADAVYIGAKQFSARRNADNFDDDSIRKTVEYCHIRGVKVYLALNIMIKQTEIQSAFETALIAYKCGVDAFIISDLGLASLIHKHLPDMQLHASTQMTIHSPAALKLLKCLGFTRAVAAREMSKKQLELLCAEGEKIGIEIEVFVHGALCMSVSGQCLMSSILGARSGNRGLCAGPCRLPFKAENGTGYDLSLKDLCLYEYIDELKQMGVASLKIEGRMKRPEYIAAATSACRSAVDKGYIDQKLFETLQAVFSRSGFTDGYYKDILGRDMFGVRTKDDVISSKDTYAYLHEIYRNERQSVKIALTAEILADKPMRLVISDGENTVEAVGDVPSLARNRTLDKDNVSESLTKFGGTPYICNSANVVVDDGLFAPASSLNALRRECVEKLNEQRATVNRNNYTLPQFAFSTDVSGDKQLIARFLSANQIPEKLNGIKAVILPFECEFPQNLPDGITLVADLPRFILDESAVQKRLKYLKEKGIDTAFCGNISAIELAKSEGFNVIGDIGLNVHNSLTAETLCGMGANALTLSAEVSVNELQKISSAVPVGIFAYGRLPLMLTRNCPLKNGRKCSDCDKQGYIVDRLDIKFPVRCRNGYSEVLNSAPLYMADRMYEISPVDFLLLNFTTESKDECEKIINDYKTAAKPDGEYTRNLYYRTLI